MRYNLALLILLSVSNVAPGAVIALEGHKAGITHIDFSADCKHLVSACPLMGIFVDRARSS